MMNSLSTGHDSADATSTSSAPQTAPVPVSADPAARASADGDPPAPSHEDQNPLWLITAAMAVFFIAAAAILAAG
jgi:hypothetical protein